MSTVVETVVIRETSRRSREKLKRLLGAELGPAYYYWPEGKMPTSGYYQIPADRLELALSVTGIKKAPKRVQDKRDNLGVAWSAINHPIPRLKEV